MTCGVCGLQSLRCVVLVDLSNCLIKLDNLGLSCCFAVGTRTDIAISILLQSQADDSSKEVNIHARFECARCELFWSSVFTSFPSPNRSRTTSRRCRAPRGQDLALGLSDVVNEANFLQQASRSCS